MRIILTFILFQIIFCSNLSANEIDLNDPYYKLGWKNLKNPTSKTIEIPDANATIEIVESEIYLDEKFDIKSYEEYVNDEVLSIDDISENLIIADNEGYYTIDVEYKDEGYISSDRFKNFTSADLIETFGKRDFDSSVKFSWTLEPKLSEDKVAVYGTKADFDDGFVIYFYSAKILGRQGFLDLTLSLSGDGTESEEFLSYYSKIIERITGRDEEEEESITAGILALYTKETSMTLGKSIKSTSIPPVTYLQRPTNVEQLYSMFPDQSPLPQSFAACVVWKE